MPAFIFREPAGDVNESPVRKCKGPSPTIDTRPDEPEVSPPLLICTDPVICPDVPDETTTSPLRIRLLPPVAIDTMPPVLAVLLPALTLISF